MSNTEKKKVIVLDKTHKKHYLKHRGLKSVIALGDNKMVVTSFGKKNEAELKYLVEKEKLTPFGNENSPKISTKDGVTKNQINFDCKDVKNGIAPVTRPDVYSNKELRKDLLGIKDKLEMQFFGKTFNDNLHVQIAYNLLDIQKILGLYIGNVVNAVLQLVDQKEYDIKNDIIGMTHAFSLYEDFCYDNRIGRKYFDEKKWNNFFEEAVEKLTKYNRYFDTVLKVYKEQEALNETKKKEKKVECQRKNLYVIQILSYLRQFSEHILLSEIVNGEKVNYNNLQKLFRNEENRKRDLSGLNKIAVAEEIVNRDRNKIIDGFKSNSTKNLYILSLILPNNQNLVEDYIDYKFSESNIKNLGINIKKIREGLLEGEKFEPNERGKINLCLDFYLWNYFKNSKETDGIIKSLRESILSENKEKIYQNIVKEIKSNNIVERVINNVKDNIRQKKVKYFFDNAFMERKLNEYFCVTSDIAKYVYILTKFMEKKEINELLTSVLNKLSNIRSLIDVAKEQNIEIWTGFNKDYFSLNNILLLERDFNNVLKLALLKENLKKAEITDDNSIGIDLYLDAFNLFTENENKIEDIELFLTDHKVRNFIIKNVINNRRFAYLLKNINVKSCKRIISNESIVKFILMKEPDSIIISYYQKIAKTPQILSRQLMVDVLYEQLNSLSLNTFKLQAEYLHKLEEDGKKNRDLNGDLIKNKELITLYLTICYLFAKGMSHTNSIYMMAWSALERDLYYRNDLKKDNNSGETEEEKILGQDYTALSDDTIEKMNCWLQEQEEKFKKAKLNGVQYLKEHKKELNQRSYKKKKHDYDCLKIDFDECHKLLDYERPVLEKRYDAKEKKKPVPNILRKLRNCIAHFNILDECFKNDRLKNIKMNYSNKDGIMNSYFGIYNYVLQQKFIEDFEKPDFNISEKLDYPFKGHKESLLNGRYDKNLLKIMYYPFAYILAKYKNLTIEDLFNDKYPIK